MRYYTCLQFSVIWRKWEGQGEGGREQAWGYERDGWECWRIGERKNYDLIPWSRDLLTFDCLLASSPEPESLSHDSV
jgi:hypothetical protein